jgi:hypothetical protein
LGLAPRTQSLGPYKISLFYVGFALLQGVTEIVPRHLIVPQVVENVYTCLDGSGNGTLAFPVQK